MKNILVTGGAGFIGSNFVYYMLRKHPDLRVVCIDALTYAGNLETLEEAMKNESFRFVKGDITDRAAVYSADDLDECPEQCIHTRPGRPARPACRTAGRSPRRDCP